METGSQKKTANGPSSSAGTVSFTWCGVSIGVYLLVGIWMALQTRDVLNPDGISYIMSARHYAAGRLDLAVNGWFGPMLSWLLVPFAWVGMDLALAARLLGVVFCLGFAFGVRQLARRLGAGRHDRLVFVAALALSLRTVLAEITPDFLLAVGLTWYFVVAADLFVAPTVRRAFLAGVIGRLPMLVPDELDRELSPFGRTLVLVFDSGGLVRLLQRDGRFRSLDGPQVHRPSGRVLWAFMYEPGASPAGGG